MSEDTHPAPGSTGVAEPTLDELLDAIAHPYRRRILTALAQAKPQEAEFSPSDFGVEDDVRDEFLTSLHHTHLPRLDGAGFITWDGETGTIREGPRYDEVEPLVELMIEHRDELPADWP